MSNSLSRKEQIKKLTVGAVLMAIVIVLQLLGSFIRFGPFSVSLVLIPIVIGAAICDAKVSTILGFTFGVAVLLSGDAAAFMQFDVFGTIVTVLLKGTLAGLAAGLVYKALEKVNIYCAIVVSALVCPIVNSGVFVLGCVVFFFEDLAAWAPAGQGTFKYIILGLVGANFIFEVLSNMILSPVVVKVFNVLKKELTNN